MRRIRISKTELARIAEAKCRMRQVYEDTEAVYFEIDNERAEETAEEVQGLLDMNEH